MIGNEQTTQPENKNLTAKSILISEELFTPGVLPPEDRKMAAIEENTLASPKDVTAAFECLELDPSIDSNAAKTPAIISEAYRKRQ